MNCPRFLQEKARLEALPPSSPEKANLALELKDLECDEETDGVCCRTQFEIVGGTIVDRVEDFPFIARIHFKTSFKTRSFCGATLIHPRPELQNVNSFTWWKHFTLFLDQNCLLLTPLATLYIELIICEICDILQLCLRLLLTAKHCIAKYFYEWCVEESDCYAYFRDLVAGPAQHERGQFTVPLIEMYEKEGRSDLAIVKLAFEV